MNQPSFGLKVKKLKDPRTFKHSLTFGAFPIEQVPNDFIVSDEKVIKDQGSTSFCSGFSNSYLIDAKENDVFSPEYYVMKEVIMARMSPLNFQGVDVETACKTMTIYGSILSSLSPYSVQNQTSDFLCDSKNWEPSLDNEAKHPFGSYFEVDTRGYKDKFDAARATMYSSKQWLICASYFPQEWISAPNGVVPKSFTPQKINAHMFAIKGSKTINGEPYLVCVNSWGTGWGDKGLYYFPREAVNTFMNIRVYRDENPDDVKAKQWSLLQQIVDWLYSIARALQNYGKNHGTN